MSTEQDVQDVTEIVLFTDYKPNDVQKVLLDIARGRDGCLKIYQGVQQEDGNNGTWVQEWTALSKHRDFEKLDIFPSFLSRVPEFGTVKRIVNAALEPQSEKEKIFTAPVTEILIAKLRPETPREKFEEILGLMHGGVKVTPGAVTSAHGITVEDPDTYVFVCGWESVEAHKKALEPEYASEMLKTMHQMLEIEVAHYALLT